MSEETKEKAEEIKSERAMKFSDATVDYMIRAVLALAVIGIITTAFNSYQNLTKVVSEVEILKERAKGEVSMTEFSELKNRIGKIEDNQISNDRVLAIEGDLREIKQSVLKINDTLTQLLIKSKK